MKARLMEYQVDVNDDHEEEVQCYTCDRWVNLYEYEIYPVTSMPFRTVYRCRECNEANGG